MSRNDNNTNYLFSTKQLQDIAQTYETPLYLYSGVRIKENYKRMHEAFHSRYENFRLCYSLKANSNLAIISLLTHLGADVDCCGSTELYLARKSGAEFVTYSAQYASRTELEDALNTANIINLDDINMLAPLLDIGIPDTLSLRVNLDIGDAYTGNFSFAGPYTKFGIAENDVLQIYSEAKSRGVQKFGIQAMCGSCVLSEEYFEIVTTRLMQHVQELKTHLNIDIEYVDIGGGFGIPYQPEEESLDMDDVAERVTRVIKEFVAEHNLVTPTLVIEPGRYIVGDAAYFLAEVQGIKQRERTYVGLNATMYNMLRLFKIRHQMRLLPRNNTLRAETHATVCGRGFTATDVFYENMLVPTPEIGDLFVVHDAGAYGYTHTSQFNGRARPAEVLILGEEHFLIREREQNEDFDKNVHIPEHPAFGTDT